MAQNPVCPAGWERLLVCTDGSPESQGAIGEALVLARLCGSKVYLLQVLETSSYFEVQATDLLARLEEEIRTQLESIKAEAAGKGVTLETRVRRSASAYAAILEEAKEVQPELIIMGRYGRTGLARLMVGSVTARVIGYSPFKVLVVPREAILSFERILVANDGSPCSEAAWQEALAVTQRVGASLFAVSVAREEGEITMAEEIVRKMLAEANRQGVPLTTLSPQGQQPDDAIVQAALRYQVSLIIMGSHGRTGLKRLLMGSVTERVIGQAPCPVLVVKER
jgi:nucleotide-binding universal stress UspA family protein